MMASTDAFQTAAQVQYMLGPRRPRATGMAHGNGCAEGCRSLWASHGAVCTVVYRVDATRSA
jgi:hypothetical protein